MILTVNLNTPRMETDILIYEVISVHYKITGIMTLLCLYISYIQGPIHTIFLGGGR